MTVRTESFTSVGGQQEISVYDVTDAQKAAAPVAVLLPALGIRASYYKRMAEAFQSHGVRTVLADLPGGETSPIRAKRGTSWGYLDLVDVHAEGLLDRVKQLFPDAPLFWLGHSIGGQVALLHAGRHGGVTGVALVASGSPHYESWNGMAKAKVWMAPRVITVIAAVMGYFPGDRLGFGGREARTLMKQWANVVRTGRFQWRGFDGEAALKAFRSPLYIATLEGDTLAPTTSADILVSKVSTVPERWHWREDEPLDHNRWPRTPKPVAERLNAWFRIQAGQPAQMETP
jgi:predicted alpha/beta hydrolase